MKILNTLDAFKKFLFGIVLFSLLCRSFILVLFFCYAPDELEYAKHEVHTVFTPLYFSFLVLTLFYLDNERFKASVFIYSYNEFLATCMGTPLKKLTLLSFTIVPVVLVEVLI